jgi:murein DD-endopeptidase MepM/ murein hydrolase activator NlpD
MTRKIINIAKPVLCPRKRRVRVPLAPALLIAALMVGVLSLSTHTAVSYLGALAAEAELASTRRDAIPIPNGSDSAESADLRGEDRLASIPGVEVEGRLAASESLVPKVKVAPESLIADAALGSPSDQRSDFETYFDELALQSSMTPSIVPARGLLTSRYGYRQDPLTGNRRLHKGIDIGARPDRPVIASASGIVTLSGRDGQLGNAVTLSHGFGLVTRYGHLSRTAVSSGEHVHQGEVIGYVGRSGRATGYHLHYEVRLDGRPVDPLHYVDGGFSSP